MSQTLSPSLTRSQSRCLHGPPGQSDKMQFLPAAAHCCSISSAPLHLLMFSTFLFPRAKSYIVTPSASAAKNQFRSPQIARPNMRLTRSDYAQRICARNMRTSSSLGQSLKDFWCQTSLRFGNNGNKKSAVANLRAAASPDLSVVKSFEVGDADSGWGESIGIDEDAPLPEHPGLVAGALPNGLRFSILRNKIPANRIFATLEVHAGSVDETDTEQVRSSH